MSTPQANKSSMRVSLLGGPDSGKSTYLGALLDGLEAGRVGHLAIESQPSDMTPIEDLTGPLLDGNYPQHTEFGQVTPLEIQMRTCQAPRQQHLPDTRFGLQLADYSGEELQALFGDRYGWSEPWQARGQSNAILLFIRPEVLVSLPRLAPRVKLDEAARWSLLAGKTAPAPVRRLEPIPAMAPVPAVIHGEALETPEAAPTDAVRIPTVLNLIELLQFLRHARGLEPGELPPEGSLRVALLVSAWDGVPPEWREAGPSRYLAEHVPLLEDFLWSNFHPLDVFRFGLSSTGGNLKDPAYREKYLEQPEGHVAWIDGTGRSRQTSDLALPIYWTLFGEAAWNLV